MNAPRRFYAVLTGCAVLLVVIVLLFVWPTPYLYVPIGTTTARVNRVTGTADMLSRSGWVRLEERPK